MLTAMAVTVTAALAVLVESASLVAVTVCVPAVAGAVYSPPVEMVPTVGLPPVTPSTDHCTPVLVVPVTVAVNCAVVFTGTAAEVGLMLTAMAVTVTVALAVLVGSALLVAVTVCEPAAAGAVYSPVAEMVPTVVLPPATPSTDHCTLVLVVPVTVAVNCFVVFTATLAEVGLMLIATPPLVTVTAAFADLVVSALLVAVTVCVPAVAGAVYRPLPEMAPTVEFPPLMPSTDQLTVLFEAPVTVAVNCCVVFVGTLALVGEMEIATCACTEAVAVKAMKQSAISCR